MYGKVCWEKLLTAHKSKPNLTVVKNSQCEENPKAYLSSLFFAAWQESLND